MANHIRLDGGATISVALALCYNDDSGRGEMGPSGSGANEEESGKGGGAGCPFTATKAEADIHGIDDDFDDIGPADPDVDETASDDIRLSDGGFPSDEREPSSLDLAALAAGNTFLTDPRSYHGAGDGDGSEDGDGWGWANNYLAYSERSESPLETNPPSRASSAEPTPVQADLGYGAAIEFEHNQSSVGPYSTQLQRRRPDMAALLSECAAAAAGSPKGSSAVGGQNNGDVGGDAFLTETY